MKQVSDTYHLNRRNGVWYYRRRVPDHLVVAVGRRVVQFSLKTTSKAEAKKLRELHDLRWSAEFDASAAGTETPAGPSKAKPKQQLPMTALLRRVQSYVQRMEGRSEQSLSQDPPTSETERRDLAADTEIGLQMLLSDDDPRGQERADALADSILRGAEAPPQEWASVTALARRALIEIDRRRLAQLRHERERVYFDPLFDPAQPPPVSFGELAARYLALREDEAAVNRTPQKSFDKVRSNVALIRLIIGDTTPVASVDYDLCLNVRSLLARVPTNWMKRYPDLALTEAVKRGRDEGQPCLSSQTQSQYLSALRDLLSLAMKKRLIPVNFAEGLGPLKRDDVALADKRRPFTPEQLTTFFRSEFYRRCGDSGPEPFRHDDAGWRFWLPFLCLFMGLRPNEACQLLVSDVRRTEKGTFYIDVAASQDDEAPTKTLKTASSRRQVPVHPELLKLGFAHFVAARGKAKCERVFDIRPDKYGNFATYPLKRFRDDFLPEAMTLLPRQTFYSFRHCFRDALRACEAGPDALLGLGGWTQGSRLASDNYGSQLGPDRLLETLREVCFPDLALRYLYVGQGHHESCKRE